MLIYKSINNLIMCWWLDEMLANGFKLRGRTRNNSPNAWLTRTDVK